MRRDLGEISAREMSSSDLSARDVPGSNLRRYDEAESHFRASIDLKPSTVGWRNLAQVSATHDGRRRAYAAAWGQSQRDAQATAALAAAPGALAADAADAANAKLLQANLAGEMSAYYMHMQDFDALGAFVASLDSAAACKGTPFTACASDQVYAARLQLASRAKDHKTVRAMVSSWLPVTLGSRPAGVTAMSVWDMATLEEEEARLGRAPTPFERKHAVLGNPPPPLVNTVPKNMAK